METNEAKQVLTEAERILRAVSDGGDKWLGIPIKCLDDGFVRLVDYMGSDAAIVQAARVSYGVGTKKLSDDRGLIRYLMRHRHTTPFEMCEVKLHVRVPMDCWRQWIRHRTANVNEYSTRYSEAINSAQKTASDSWRSQSTTNKQGSGDFLVTTVGARLSMEEEEFQRAARKLYEGRLTAGVAREQARKDLPLSTYTEAYWKCDLHNLFHFLGLRLDAHAQHEIRIYANAIAEIVKDIFPISYQAFDDFVACGMDFSGLELDILASNIWPMEREKAYDIAFACMNNKRETEDFIVKLQRIGHLKNGIFSEQEIAAGAAT